MLKWSWLTTPTTPGYTGSAEPDFTFKNSNRLIVRGNGPQHGGKGVVLSYEARDFVPYQIASASRTYVVLTACLRME
ncbi:MAG: hypothetical protein AVDCRST_MAG12-102 [uncultured Rubrobacteraceae bacterium]|uniref:Uncharacterized protein n=1 Tax=uncultured Rubrobacteraceae bacterium TaxID=349277 RepID=A0A6J4R6H7_9ACTN|nr:MAG: hypothetical protein AVDCRST_MAG12-102 [uncultured Rubrobacteraceae bacterium]